MTVTAGVDPAGADALAVKRQERRTLGVATGAHALHDGYTDLIWIALPIWQAEFGLSYAAVGLLRTIFTGTMASLQIPTSIVAERIGGGVVLALGTALCGLCYVLAGFSDGFWWLVAALFLGGLGAATQHPIGSALVAQTFAGARSLKALGTYNFSGDVGKVLIPATATTLILFMPWRPAYALLGALGVIAAIAIYFLTPRFALEAAAKKAAPAVADVAESARMRTGYRVLLIFGVADSIMRGAFFVLLPFLLIGKGAAVTTAGYALTLVFVGGAAGKLACGWVASWFGIVATIVFAQAVTGLGILGVLYLPLEFAIALLPLLGIVLNGVTTVIYGSVPEFVTPQKRARAFSVFYTITLGALAAAPPLGGLAGDLVGIPSAVIIVAAVAFATIPLAFLLKHAQRAAVPEV